MSLSKPAIRQLPKNVIVLTLTSFLTDVSSEMLFNLLPLFLYNVLGVSTAAIGVVEGVAETTSSLLKIYAGGLSDRLEKRKTLATIGYSISSIAKPFLFFANSWLWVLIVRFGDRVGKGVRTAPRDALLSASIKKEQRGLAFGLHRAGDTAGAFTGLAIATLIIAASQSGESVLTRITFQHVVLASIIPGFLSVLIIGLGAREASPAVDRSMVAQPKVKIDRRFYSFISVVTLFTLGNSSDAFIILRGQERGLNVIQVMGMLLSFNAVYALLSGPAGYLSDRIGRRRLLVAGWLIYSVIYLGFAIAQNGLEVWTLFGFYGLYYAMVEGVSRAFVADLVPAAQRGTAYGFYHAAVGLATLPASLIAGVLWQGLLGWKGFGPSAPFYFGAILALLSSILLITYVKNPAV